MTGRGSGGIRSRGPRHDGRSGLVRLLFVLAAATVFTVCLVQFGVAGAIVEGIGDSVQTPAPPTTSPTPSDHLDTDGEWRFGIDRNLRAPYTSVEVEPRNVHFTQLETMAFVNAQRAERGLDPLFWNEELSQLNRWYARQVYSGEGFFHVNPDTGRGPSDRAAWAGYPVDGRCAVYSEVVTTGGYSSGVTNVERNAALIVEAWMRSEGHREQILHERYDVAGIGVFVGENGTRVAVMTMCDRRYVSEGELNTSDVRFRNNDTVIPYEVAVRDGGWDPTGNLTETPMAE